MRTFYRFMLLSALLLPGLVRAEELFKGTQVVNLAFPPGERMVVRLADAGQGVIGVIGGENNVLHAVIIAGNQATAIPDGELGRIPAAVKPFAIDPESPLAFNIMQQSGYSLAKSGKLVKLDGTGTITEIGQVAGTRPFEPKGYQISRAIVQGPDGALYTAGANGAIFKYDGKKLEKLNASLPAVKGREPWASLDAGVFGPDGLLYGGTFDGYLFTFDPKTLQVVNLGKPFRTQRIRGLAFRGGKLIGIGGDDDGMPRSFAFNPQTRGFELGGAIADPNGPFPLMEPIGAMFGLPDGTIYFSTTGRLANLYVWKPDAK